MEKTDRVNVTITNADGVLVGTMRRAWLPGGGVALSLDIDGRPKLVKYCKTAAEIRTFIIEIWADFKGLIPRERKTAQQAVLNLANLYGGEISNQKGTGILDLARRAEFHRCGDDPMIRVSGRAGHEAKWQPAPTENVTLRVRGHALRVKSVTVVSRKTIRDIYARGRRIGQQANINGIIWRRIFCEFGYVFYEFMGEWLNLVHYSRERGSSGGGRMVEKTIAPDEIEGLDAIPAGTRPQP